jgi:hypothetical protein
MFHVLENLHNVSGESQGVAGFHLNGEIACWESLGLVFKRSCMDDRFQGVEYDIVTFSSDNVALCFGLIDGKVIAVRSSVVESEKTARDMGLYVERELCSHILLNII